MTLLACVTNACPVCVPPLLQTDEAGTLDTEKEMKVARAEMMDIDDDGKTAGTAGASTSDTTEDLVGVRHF